MVFVRRDWAAVTRIAGVTVVLSTVAAFIAILFFVATPNMLISAFLDAEDTVTPEILRIGTLLLIVAAMFQFVDAAQVVALSLLRGLQDTKVPMLIATVSYWIIGMPISYVLGFVLDFKETGIWLGLVFGLGVAALLLWARFAVLTLAGVTRA